MIEWIRRILKETEISKPEEVKRGMDNITEATELWTNVLAAIRNSVSQITYDTWLKKINPVKIENKTLILATALDKTKEFVTYNFMDKILNALGSVNSYVDNVEILTFDEEAHKAKILIKEQSKPREVEVVEEPRIDNDKFNKEFTFDNFVVGEFNEIVFAAAKGVVEDPGSKINPLFIYGGVGLGKTHIIHAIANKIIENNPNVKIQYSTTDRFISDFIDSINKSKDNELIKEFRKKYRNVDILMLDDIQFLNGKSATQETLFHIFNDLMQEHKQIIFTSDRHPKELSQIEERMRSRFLSGLTLDIGYPDLETRIAILQKKVYQKKYCIKSDILEFIAEKIDTNVRELEGALNKVAYTCTLTNREPTIEIVNQILKDEIDSKSGPLTMELITGVVSEYFSVPVEDIMSAKRSKNIAEARQMAIYIISELMSAPLTSIGEYLGGRDHTTIIHSRDKISALIKDNTVYKKYAGDIIERIRKG